MDETDGGCMKHKNMSWQGVQQWDRERKEEDEGRREHGEQATQGQILKGGSGSTNRE